MAMNFMRLDDVVMSGDGYYQSMAYHAFLNLELWSFSVQCLYCLICLAMGYWLAPRVGQALLQGQRSHLLVRFAQDAGPAIVASTLMAVLVGAGLALSVPLYEQLVVWKVLSLTAWVLGVRVLSWVLRVLLRPHGLLGFLLRCIEWGVVLSMVLTFFGLLQPLMDLVASVQFSVGSQVFKGANIVGGVITAVLALTIAGQLTQFIERGLAKYSAHQHLLSNDALILSRLLGLTIFVLTAIGVLVGSGIDPATLTAFVGALGIGLGFGLQEVVVNFVSGVFLLFERAVKPGDYVTVGNISGQVVELGHRSLIIRDAVGTENLIPNTTLSRGVVQNHTRSSNEFRVSFVLRLANIAQHEAARVLIEQAMRRHSRVLTDRPLGCLVTGIYADEATLELSCWINDLQNGQKGLVSDLLQVIGQSFQEQGIALAHSPRGA